MSTSQSNDDCSQAEVILDLTESLKRDYGLSDLQIESSRASVFFVALKIHGELGDFPGWGHSSVSVYEMTDQPIHGYVPLEGGRVVRVWTQEP